MNILNNILAGQIPMVAYLGVSLIMFFAEYCAKKNKSITVGRGFLIGLYQTLALFPGMSRSGATISGGLFTGLTREEATRFSFLLSFPIILGSGAKELLGLGSSILSAPLMVGCLVAFIVGIISIHFLVSYLKKHTMNVFVVYRVLLVIVLLVMF